MNIEPKSKRKKKLFLLTGKAMCRKSSNVKNKIWEAPTETKLWFVPSTSLNGPTCYHLVLHPRLILIPLWTVSAHKTALKIQVMGSSLCMEYLLAFRPPLPFVFFKQCFSGCLKLCLMMLSLTDLLPVCDCWGPSPAHRARGPHSCHAKHKTWCRSQRVHMTFL